MRSAKNRWAAWSAIVAALSLAAALVFNGIQAHNSAVAQNQAKLATELSLLTQLQSAMSEAVYSRGPYAPQFDQLQEGKRGSLTPPAYRATAVEASTMDYLAWLFNNRYLTTDGADEIWGPRMICEYKQAFAPAFQVPTRDLPELIDFIQERGHRLSKLTEPC